MPVTVTVTDRDSAPSRRATAAPAPWVAAVIEVGADGSIQVWEHWLTKGPLIMRGQIVSPDQLRLEGVGSQPGGPLVLIRQGGAR